MFSLNFKYVQSTHLSGWTFQSVWELKTHFHTLAFRAALWILFFGPMPGSSCLPCYSANQLLTRGYYFHSLQLITGSHFLGLAFGISQHRLRLWLPSFAFLALLENTLLPLPASYNLNRQAFQIKYLNYIRSTYSKKFYLKFKFDQIVYIFNLLHLAALAPWLCQWDF